MTTIAALDTITGEALEQLRALISHGISAFNDRITYDPQAAWNLEMHVTKYQCIHTSIRALAAEVTTVTAGTFPADYAAQLVALVEWGIDDFDYQLDYSPAEIADLDPPLKERTILHENILATVRTFH